MQTPKTAEDLISVVNITQTSVDGERCYALYYAFGGVVAQEPLIVSEDVRAAQRRRLKRLRAVICCCLIRVRTDVFGRCLLFTARAVKHRRKLQRRAI